nr:immunoglobulin light chain junction region [Macaca mulatta]MOV76207.1 immunoglobulin light chain junction region [Macaca mulatta]
CMQGTHLPRTF